VLSIFLSVKLDLERNTEVDSVLKGQEERKVGSVLLLVRVNGGRGPSEGVLGASNLILLTRRQVREGDSCPLNTDAFEWK
jgi:hypothetical protein